MSTGTGCRNGWSAFQRQRQIAALGVGEIGYALHVRFRQQQRFERPAAQ